MVPVVRYMVRMFASRKRIVLWSMALFMACCGHVSHVEPVRAPISDTPRSGPVVSRVTSERMATVDPEVRGLPQVRAFELCTSSGACTYVLEAGAERASSPVPLVLVHGLGERGVRDFYPILDQLAQTRRVIAIDLPGLGRSTLGEEYPSPSVFAARIRDVLAQRVAGSFDLLGHSLGGVSALLAAAEHRDRVRHLVLIDVAGVLHREAFVGSTITGALAGLRNSSARAAQLVEGAGKAVASALRVFEPSDATVTFGTRELAGAQAQAAFALIQQDVGPTLDLVTAPTLLLWGANDTIAPLRTAQVLDDRIASSELFVLHGVGHVPMAERPNDVVEAVRSFLDDSTRIRERTEPSAKTLKDFACENESDLTIRGQYRRISMNRCHRLHLERVRAERLTAEDSDGEIIQSTFMRGIEAVESDLVITGGKIEGEVALLLEESRIDMAGTRITGTRAAVLAVDDSRVLFSLTAARSPYTQGSLHGHVGLEDGQGL